MNRMMPVPMRQVGSEPEPEPLPDDQLPSLFMSLLPVILPVVLIGANTVLTQIADSRHAALLTTDQVTDWTAFQAAIVDQENQSDPSPGGRIMQELEGVTGNDADAARRTAELIRRPEPLSEEEQAEVVDGLNRFVLGSKQFYQEEAFAGQ